MWMALRLWKFQKHAVNFYRIRLYASTANLDLKDPLPASAYQPELVELKSYYKQCEENGHFQPTEDKQQDFSMVLPPPNVTGKLHLGHALGCVIQDVIARRERSLGKNVLWIPGTDHAGIATQTVVEKYLKKANNVTRHEMGRENFLRSVLKWKNMHGNTIVEQLRSLGCSLDWSREIFTMDVKRNHAVNVAFIDLFTKGLIYRKKAMVNWCTALNSTVSDIEVESRDIRGPTTLRLPGLDKPVQFGQLYTFAYPIYDSAEEILVSTTRPETMLGDVAIAVNPNDARYTHFIGKYVLHPFRNETIPIIGEDFVADDIGTGAVKITSAHSKIDYEVAFRNSLPLLQVIDENGNMINAGEYTNMNKYACREAIVERLSDLGLLKNVEYHSHILPICSRTGDVIEYLPKEQWFISCEKMNEYAKNAVEDGTLTLEPDNYVKDWMKWCNDNRDWCISRQLWWGHQIPAYKCTTLDSDYPGWVAALNEDEAKEKAAMLLNIDPDDVRVERDQDVLDTWFSSAIYPFAALGWPEITRDSKFYPLSLMVTGHDILGFWVHRMAMLGMELTNQLPFHHVLLHGIICDNTGAKMSKSRGNIIDPTDVINGITMEELKRKTDGLYKVGTLSLDEVVKADRYHESNFKKTNGIPQCGVDAFRFTLLTQDIKSHFVNFDVQMCHANKLFCNKIWQSVKYAQLRCSQLPYCTTEFMQEDLTYFDKWILSRLAEVVRKVNSYMDNHEFHLATKVLKNHLHNEFCDVYLESTKLGFNPTSPPNVAYGHAHTLTAVLGTTLRCLSPFMVYLTQALIPKIPEFEHNLIVNFKDKDKGFYQFPQYEDFEIWKDESLENRATKLLGTASIVRSLKGICGMPGKLRPAVTVKTSDDILRQDLAVNLPVVLNLACCSNLDFAEGEKHNYIRAQLDNESEVWMEVLGADVANTIHAAKAKIQKKIQKIEISLRALEKKFSNEVYLSSVAEWNLKEDRDNLNRKREELKQLSDELERLASNWKRMNR